MKRLLIVLLLSFYLTSCYNYQELRSASFCFGITIDYDEAKESKYSFSLETQTAKRTSSKGEFESSVHDIKGDTFAEAISNLPSTTTGIIDFTHCKVIFLSKDINSKDLKDLSFYLFYNPILSNNVNIIVSNEKTAKEILSTKSLTETSTSFEVVSSLNNPNSYYNYGFKKTLTDFYNDLHGELGNFLIPTAGIVKSNEEQTSSLKGARLYNDFEFKKFLDNDELRNTLVLTKNIKTFLTNLETKEKLLTLYIDSFKRKSEVKHENDKINFNYKLKLNISSSENQKKHEKIKKLLKEKLKEQIENDFIEAQKENIDLYLLKVNLYKYNYKLYKEKKSNFNIKEVNFNIEIDINVKQRGVLR